MVAQEQTSTAEKASTEGVISPHLPAMSRLHLVPSVAMKASYLPNISPSPGYVSASSRAERRDEADHQQRAEEVLTPRGRATLANSRSNGFRQHAQRSRGASLKTAAISPHISAISPPSLGSISRLAKDRRLRGVRQHRPKPRKQPVDGRSPQRPRPPSAAC